MSARILKFVLWVAFAAGVLELSARLILFPQYTAMLPDMYWQHPVLGHYNKPDLAVRRFNPLNYDVVNHTNALGMRGQERDRQRELSGVWIAGGSNTFGGYIPDDEVFAAGLKRHEIWAANLASEGHSIASQAAMLRVLAKEGYRPESVVLVLSMYFAIRDYSADFEALTKPDAGRLAAEPVPVQTARKNLMAALAATRDALPGDFQSVRARLLKSSALYGWFKVGIMGIPALRGWTLSAGLRNDLDYVQNFDLDLLRPLSAGNPARLKIDSTADYVAAVAKMVRDTFDVPFGVAILPAHHQLHPGSFMRYVAHHGLDAEDLKPLRALAALKTALERRDISVVDTYPALRDSGVPRLTFPDDGHLTARAHGIIARVLATWLKNDMRASSADVPGPK